MPKILFPRIMAKPKYEVHFELPTYAKLKVYLSRQRLAEIHPPVNSRLAENNPKRASDTKSRFLSPTPIFVFALLYLNITPKRPGCKMFGNPVPQTCIAWVN